MPFYEPVCVFFYLSKIFSLFFAVVPFFYLVTLLLILFLKGPFKRIALIVHLVFGLLCTDFVADFLLRILENRYDYKQIDEIVRADAVVVAGGMVNPVNTRSLERPEFTNGVDRMLYGLDLMRKNKADILIFTGGSGLITQAGQPEAYMLKDYLYRRSFDFRVYSESESRNTAENAIYTRKIADQYGIQTIILVTSAFHMPRAVAAFEKAGFQVIPFPVDYRASYISMGPEAYFPSAHALMKSSLAIKEFIGLIAYSIRGYI